MIAMANITQEGERFEISKRGCASRSRFVDQMVKNRRTRAESRQDRGRFTISLLVGRGTLFFITAVLLGVHLVGCKKSDTPVLIREVARFSPFLGDQGEHFGTCRDHDGDYLIVGSPGDLSSRQEGKVYVYHRTGEGVWDQGTQLVTSEAAKGGRPVFQAFGYTCAISGDYAVVGTAGFNDGHPNHAAYVFHRTGPNSWDMGVKILPPDARYEDFFSSTVAIDGDYLAVAAHADIPDGNGGLYERAGAVYVFRRTGTNQWSSAAKVVAPKPEKEPIFGWFLSLKGSVLIVGTAVTGPDPDSRMYAYELE